MLINLHIEEASKQIWWVGLPGINDDDGDGDGDCQWLIAIVPNPQTPRSEK